jgi:hypothetical protein
MTQICADKEMPSKNSALPLISLCLCVFVVKLFCFSCHLRTSADQFWKVLSSPRLCVRFFSFLSLEGSLKGIARWGFCYVPACKVVGWTAPHRYWHHNTRIHVARMRAHWYGSLGFRRGRIAVRQCDEKEKRDTIIRKKLDRGFRPAGT